MKKVIVIASAILFFILLLLLSLSRPKNQSQTNQTKSITPTLIQTNINRQPLNQQSQRTINNALPLTPYENDDFRFDYSPTLNQLVVTEKTPQAKQQFVKWANNNGLPDLAANPELVVFQSNSNGQPITNFPQPSLSPSSSPFSEFLGNFMNLGKGNGTTTNELPAVFSNSNPTDIPVKPNSPNSNTYYYYAQCDSEYSSLPLPDGCNMCQAGCGAATVAMIASSYLGPKYDPKTIIGLYDKNNYLLSCDGSRYSDAKAILESLGLKTTDYITFDLDTADQIVDDLKKYLASGWTFFTLANFKDEGGGHYFWITEIDSKGNVWAYDPYYGRFEAPPINENDRYPFPKYRLVFGVKK